MKKREILTVDELESFIREATVDALGDALEPIRKAELERQRAQSQNVKDLRSKKGSQEMEEADEADEEAPEEGGGEGELASKVPKVTKKKLEKARLPDVVKMLNVLRSGRSVKDPPIQKKLKAYLDQLAPEQRETLYIFLTGLSEIMVGDEAGKEAMDPEQVGIKISVPKKKEEEKEEVVVRDEEKEGTAETPIIVGEVANKARLRRVFRENARK